MNDQAATFKLSGGASANIFTCVQICRADIGVGDRDCCDMTISRIFSQHPALISQRFLYICINRLNFNISTLRRIISILLLGLLLYNMVGYSIVYLSEEHYAVRGAGKGLVEQSYGSADIVLKVPVAVPYQNNWDAPEPVQGQIEHEGQFYQMKSRQLLNDTMYVHCEFDQNARDRFSDLVSKINDQVTGQSSDTSKDQHSNILKNFLKEYMTPGRKHVFYVLEWEPSRDSFAFAARSILPERYSSLPSPPPDLA